MITELKRGNYLHIMITVYRNSVQSWEIDQMGHMNVQFYFEKALQGCVVLWNKLGINEKPVELGNTYLSLVRAHIRFLKEQKPGAPFFLKMGIVELGDVEVKLYLEMIETITNRPCAAFNFQFLWTSNPLEGMKKNFPRVSEELRVDIPSYGQPRGLSLEKEDLISLSQASKKNMIDSFESVILLRQCDNMNKIKPSAYMGVVSDSTPHLLAYTGTIDENGMTNVGSAALEYKFDFFEYVPLGTHLKIKSGIQSMSNKTFVWKHWIFNVETGKPVALASAVAVTMDLEARKSIPIPPEMAEALTKLIL